MISGTGVLLAFALFALLGVAAAIVWWINRTPSAYRRSAQSELPLFSVSLTESRYSPVKPQSAIPSARAANGRSGKVESPSAERQATVGRAAGVATATSAASSAVPAASSTTAASPSVPAASTTAATPSASPAVPAASTTAATPSASSSALFSASSAPHAASSAPTTAPSAPPSTRTPSGQRPSANAAPSSPAPARPIGADTPLVPEPTQSVVADGVPGTQVEGHLLRFAVPQEGTLQFLPGRLEILNGLDAGREVRFVRAPGPDGLQVTFGRSEGPAYRHVQLREGTVSRSHARMALREGAWYLTNLSSTNPVVHNEHILSPGEERLLEDGDRIEMGEVVFGFRSR